METTTTGCVVKDDGGGLSVTVLKVILGLVMIILTLVFGLLPIRLLKYLRKRAARGRKGSSSDGEEEEGEGAEVAAVDVSGGRRWPGLVLCLLSCFTGGVFLGTCFLHLLPEVNEHLIRIKEQFSWSTEYPLGELISCAGFFLVFFVEEIVVSFLQGGHGHSHAPQLGADAPVLVHVHGAEDRPTDRDDETTSLRASELHLRVQGNGRPFHISPASHENSKGSLVDGVSNKADTAKFSSNTSPFTERARKGSRGEEMIPLSVLSSSGKSGVASSSSHPHLYLQRPVAPPHPRLPRDAVRPQRAETERLFLCDDTDCLSPKRRNYGSCHELQHAPNEAQHDEVFTSLEVAEPERCEGPCEGQDEDPPILMTSRPHPHSHEVRSITLVLALSFHSVLEGLAFGITEDTSAATTLFLSLIIHKVIVAFSVGLQLARTHAHQLRLVLLSIVLLAAMSPVGITIGILVQTTATESEGKEVVLLIFEGAAVGTFIYVTFFEVLIHERDNEHPNLLKLLVIIVGFGLIASLRMLEHSHGDDGHAANATLCDPHPHDH